MSLAWGGYQNGLIPQDVLVAVGKDSFGQVQYLEASAARAYFALDAAFYREFHKHLVVNYGDRALAAQKEMYAAYLAHPATNPYAAYPGTSNHGWARACDFGSDTQYAGTPEANWLKEHGPEYGFWPTGYGFPKVEPWHYDFRPGTATASLDSTLIDTIPTIGRNEMQYAVVDGSLKVASGEFSWVEFGTGDVAEAASASNLYGWGANTITMTANQWRIEKIQIGKRVAALKTALGVTSDSTSGPTAAQIAAELVKLIPAPPTKLTGTLS